MTWQEFFKWFVELAYERYWLTLFFLYIICNSTVFKGIVYVKHYRPKKDAKDEKVREK